MHLAHCVENLRQVKAVIWHPPILLRKEAHYVCTSQSEAKETRSLAMNAAPLLLIGHIGPVNQPIQAVRKRISGKVQRQ